MVEIFDALIDSLVDNDKHLEYEIRIALSIVTSQDFRKIPYDIKEQAFLLDSWDDIDDNSKPCKYFKYYDHEMDETYTIMIKKGCKSMSNHVIIDVIAGLKI